MKIVTTPMCEKILEFVGIVDYKVNKNPDNEDGDLAIILSESNTKMDSLKIKLNTFSQIKNSIIQVSKIKNILNKHYNSNSSKFNWNEIDFSFYEPTLNSQEINDIFLEYPLASDWLDMNKKNVFQEKNSKINVEVYSSFLRDIIIDMGFNILDLESDSSNIDYIIFPDYMDIDEENKKYGLISIPTHNNVSKNPIKRAELRYSILNNLKS